MFLFCSSESSSITQLTLNNRKNEQRTNFAAYCVKHKPAVSLQHFIGNNKKHNKTQTKTETRGSIESLVNNLRQRKCTIMVKTLNKSGS